MSYNVIIGRNESDLKNYGDVATTLIGKQYITMGNVVSLGNQVLLDVLRPHVVLIAGKRGSGKSYTMGVISEGLASLPEEVAENVTSLIIDTMGIYWTMKSPNYKEEEVLKKWGEEPKAFNNVKVFVPKGHFETLKEQNASMVDAPFSISVSDLSASDWTDMFKFSINDEYGVLINKAIEDLVENGQKYGIPEILDQIDRQIANDTVKEACKQRFESANGWGIFEKDGTPIEALLTPGYINILDISLYAHSLGGFNLRALVIGLLSQKILEIRVIERRSEELKDMNSAVMFKEDYSKKRIPIVWMFIDEVHEFLPANKKTAASEALSRVVKEGRQPGIALVIATQQPGKLDTDIITQSDIIISQHVTAKLDIDALNTVMQTYMSTDIKRYLTDLPKLPGACIILDDNSERIYPVQVKPRYTWHGGETPKAVPPSQKQE
ncbi:MAG: DUF87 domain-containing protein [Candidatus Parvarchaeota archaeon]|nr:DUF87 domain-containing protein [Candidatus Parvarchaeota archaeon]